MEGVHLEVGEEAEGGWGVEQADAQWWNRWWVVVVEEEQEGEVEEAVDTDSSCADSLDHTAGYSRRCRRAGSPLEGAHRA